MLQGFAFSPSWTRSVISSCFRYVCLFHFHILPSMHLGSFHKKVCKLKYSICCMDEVSQHFLENLISVFSYFSHKMINKKPNKTIPFSCLTLATIQWTSHILSLHYMKTFFPYKPEVLNPNALSQPIQPYLFFSYILSNNQVFKTELLCVAKYFHL